MLSSFLSLWPRLCYLIFRTRVFKLLSFNSGVVTVENLDERERLEGGS